MNEPIFWLGVSLCLVAVCLALALMAAIPAFQELTRAARSAEKLFDTLHRELPPTLDAIRMTGLEITDLKEDVSEGVEKTTQVVGQVDQSIASIRHQVQQTHITTTSVLVGLNATWKSLIRSSRSRSRRSRRKFPKR